MKKSKHRVGTRIYQCNEISFVKIHFTWSDTVPAKLAFCNNCNELFYYDEDGEKYIAPIQEFIKNLTCPTCGFKLSDTFTNYTAKFFLKNCVSYKSIQVNPFDIIEIYNIYL